jgi:hypothetical protein
MMPGNHDADLFWPKVQKAISARLAQSVPGGAAALSGRFAFRLERNLLVERSGHRYWIEHGHQHDPPNSFFPGGTERWSAAAPPIFRDKLGHWRLYECPGTLGLVRHINHWRPAYRSISYIKPYSKVLRALIAHRAFSQPGRPIMVLRHLVAMLGWDVNLQTALADGDVGQACHQALQELVQSMLPAEEVELLQVVANAGVKIDIPLREYVQTSARRQRILDCFAREGVAGADRDGLHVSETTLGFVIGGFIDDAETKALVETARELIRTGQANYVITGHTHSPCQKLRGGFTNGGCWVANQTVESKAAATAAIFEHGPVRYVLSYVEIPSGGPPLKRNFGRGHIAV